MAAVRQLVRSGRSGLRIIALTGSLDVDLLVGAGVADRVVFCFVSLGPFGLAPRFRRGLEGEYIIAEEHSGHGLTTALEAASRGFDFLPFYGPVGTTLADRYETIRSPVSRRPVQIATAITPDVCIVHAAAATHDGHVRLADTVGADVITARAAKRVVVTAERLVERLPVGGGPYLGPANVDVVIEAPWGAHPLAFVPDYGMDWRVLLAYADAAATQSGFDGWLQTHLGPAEQDWLATIDERSRQRLRLIGSPGGVG
jgi:glutaconate CoA-transferase subunit A